MVFFKLIDITGNIKCKILILLKYNTIKIFKLLQYFIHITHTYTHNFYFIK